MRGATAIAVLCALIGTASVAPSAAAVAAPRAARSGATGTSPAASVEIAPTGKLGRFRTAIVTVEQSCRSDAVVAELVVDVVQGSVSGSRAGTFGAVCDGMTHDVQVEVFSDTGDNFIPGPADVSARFTVLDDATMDPLPQAVDHATVTLLAPGDVAIGQEARLSRFNQVIVPILYRCQTPWIVSELSVTITQGALGGSAFRDTGLRCDARWHHLDIGIGSDNGDPFAVGFADIDVRLTLQDPESFDPVWQAHAAQRTWVAPAARIVIESAAWALGTVRVAVAVRCQRPWVVAEWIVSVTQRNGRVAGGVHGDSGFTCDAQWHHFTVSISSSPPFRPRRTVVAASLDVLDPVDFDPVDQATDRRVFNLS